MSASDCHHFSLDRSAGVREIAITLRSQGIDARLLYSVLVISGKEGAEQARAYLSDRGLRFVHLEPGCRNACCREGEPPR